MILIQLANNNVNIIMLKVITTQLMFEEYKQENDENAI